MSVFLPEGYTCGLCGRFSKFSSWLFSHWKQEVIHTCACGARSQIKEGVATLKHFPKNEQEKSPKFSNNWAANALRQ